MEPPLDSDLSVARDRSERDCFEASGFLSVGSPVMALVFLRDSWSSCYNTTGDDKRRRKAVQHVAYPGGRFRRNSALGGDILHFTAGWQIAAKIKTWEKFHEH